MKTNNIVKNICLTALLVLQAAAVKAQDYFEPISMEGVTLKGFINEAIINNQAVLDRGMYDFRYENRFEPMPADMQFEVYAAGGATYHDGKIYCNVFDGTRNLADQYPCWTIYDAVSYEKLDERELDDNCECTTKSIAYDPVTNKIYGVVKTFTEYFFVRIEPETGEMTQIGERMNYDKKFVSLACNNKGVLYCIYIEGEDTYLAKIRKSDGKIANIGVITPKNLLKDDRLINFAYAQSLFFNNATGKLYWILPSSSIYLEMEYTAIMEVDTELATATLVSYIQKSLHVSGAYLDEPELSAPGIISDFSYSPLSSGGTSGILKMKMPETRYNGEKLTGSLTVSISENDIEIASIKGNPGDIVETENLEFTNEKHNVSICVTNEAGEDGPAIHRSFYAGWDVPAECQNIRLTSDGLKTMLTWDAPVKGMNGAPINTENYTYKVIRYPNEVIVAENYGGFTFEEEHPEDMTRYVYKVIPYDASHREGKAAFSNNLIVGTPLDVPYGGSFKDPRDFFNYYTILDANNDRYSWSYDANKNYAVYSYNWQQDADDWMLTPPINYKKGRTYTMSFKAYSSDVKYPEAMEVKWGSTRNPDDFSETLLELPEVPGLTENNEATEYNVEFTAPEDGIFYFGIHVFSPAYSGLLYIYDIIIDEKGNTGIDDVINGRNIDISTGNGCITISNPDNKDVVIYDSCGKMLYSGNETVISRQLETGVYIVKAGGMVNKIIVL